MRFRNGGCKASIVIERPEQSADMKTLDPSKSAMDNECLGIIDLAMCNAVRLVAMTSRAQPRQPSKAQRSRCLLQTQDFYDSVAWLTAQ